MKIDGFTVEFSWHIFDVALNLLRLQRPIVWNLVIEACSKAILFRTRVNSFLVDAEKLLNFDLVSFFTSRHHWCLESLLLCKLLLLRLLWYAKERGPSRLRRLSE